jgi:HlyD family secretion protein
LSGSKKKTGEIQECVFVLEKGAAKKVNVKSGIQDNTYIQILSGLKEGQEVDQWALFCHFENP